MNLHSLFIVLHTISGIVAFVAGWMTINQLRLRKKLAPTTLWIYLGGLVGLVVFMIGAILAHWVGLTNTQRLIYLGLSLLGIYMLFRAYQAHAVQQKQDQIWALAYVDHVGFTLISLFDGFVIVSAIDMTTVLITGASRGLGRALATELAQRKYDVIATARDVKDLSGLPAARRLALDVTSLSSVRQAAEAAGEVDVLVNNAGILLEGPVEAIPIEQAKRTFETNVYGPLRLIQALLPGMRRRKRGLIVHISSVASQFVPPLEGIYAASKAALEMIGEAMRFETRHFGVKVVVIQSGSIATDLVPDEPDFSLEAYTPLVEQYERQRQQYSQTVQKAMPREVARKIADVIERENPPLRVKTGNWIERLLATFSGLGRRLVKQGLDW